MPASVITVHVRAPLEALQRQFHELLPGRKVVIETLADDSLRLRVEVGTGTAPLEEAQHPDHGHAIIAVAPQSPCGLVDRVGNERPAIHE